MQIQSPQNNYRLGAESIVVLYTVPLSARVNQNKDQKELHLETQPMLCHEKAEHTNLLWPEHIKGVLLTDTPSVAPAGI